MHYGCNGRNWFLCFAIALPWHYSRKRGWSLLVKVACWRFWIFFLVIVFFFLIFLLINILSPRQSNRFSYISSSCSLSSAVKTCFFEKASETIEASGLWNVVRKLLIPSFFFPGTCGYCWYHWAPLHLWTLESDWQVDSAVSVSIHSNNGPHITFLQDNVREDIIKQTIYNCIF